MPTEQEDAAELAQVTEELRAVEREIKVAKRALKDLEAKAKSLKERRKALLDVEARADQRRVASALDEACADDEED